MRRKYQITRNRVQLHSRLESLLEEAQIKLSSLVSDLLLDCKFEQHLGATHLRGIARKGCAA